MIGIFSWTAIARSSKDLQGLPRSARQAPHSSASKWPMPRRLRMFTSVRARSKPASYRRQSPIVTWHALLSRTRSGRNQARGARVEDVVRLGNRVGRRTRPRQMRTAVVHPKLSTPSAGRTWRCICSKDLPSKGPEPRVFGGNLPPCSARAGPCRPQRPPHARSYGWTSRPRERRRARRGSQVRRSCPSRGDARSKLSGAAPRGARPP